MKSQASSKPREMFQEIVVYRHHSGYDQNALKPKKTGSGKEWKASPLTTVDNINKYRDKNHVIIGEEWG